MYRKVGGLHFLRIGRFGMSFYVARRPFDPSALKAAWAESFLASMNRHATEDEVATFTLARMGR